MLRQLDSDIWETIASCLQFRLMNHWTEDTESVNTAGHHGQEKELPNAMLPTVYWLYSKTLQQLAGGALQSRRGPVGRPMKWCGCSHG